MISTLEIAWLAGIIEGEGSFTTAKGCPAIQLQMTDEDVIVRARRLLNATERKPWKRADGHKIVYGCTITGTKAISWMMTLYSLMGTRRQSKIKSILDQWKASKAAPRASRGTRLMAVCHPDRKRMGNMLCGTCYMREWRKKTGHNTAFYRAQAST